MLGGERSRKQADKCMRSGCVCTEEMGAAAAGAQKGTGRGRGLQAAPPGLGGAAHGHGWRKLPIPACRLANWSSCSPWRVL